MLHASWRFGDDPAELDWHHVNGNKYADVIERERDAVYELIDDEGVPQHIHLWDQGRGVSICGAKDNVHHECAGKGKPEHGGWPTVTPEGVCPECFRVLCPVCMAEWEVWKANA